MEGRISVERDLFLLPTLSIESESSQVKQPFFSLLVSLPLPMGFQFSLGEFCCLFSLLTDFTTILLLSLISQFLSDLVNLLNQLAQ